MIPTDRTFAREAAMSFRELIFLILASWRLTKLVSSEAGPGNIFGRLRNWLMVQSPNNVIANEIRMGLSCPLCAGVWFSALLVGASKARAGAGFVLIMAIAGGTAAMQLIEGLYVSHSNTSASLNAILRNPYNGGMPYPPGSLPGSPPQHSHAGDVHTRSTKLHPVGGPSPAGDKE